MGIKCPKCQSDNTDTARFCSNCATPLPSQEVSVTKTLETPTRILAIGSIFAERYEILEALGKGGMGEVYKVKDEKLDEEMALKVLKSEIAADKGIIERFKNELKFARKIAHRNVCKMYDLNEEEETPYITMEYAKGEDLKSFIRKKRKLTEKESIAVAMQVCEGLAEAHRLGVVHRDLKPQNIMIDKDGDTKVMDFGIARSVEAPGVTQSGVMIGTPDYMSPEQAEGEEADQRSDIYALGVILYEMVTGGVPFKGDTAFSVALKHKSKLPSDPKKLNPEISENLSRLILICMEKERKRRYQSAEALLADLRNIEEGFPLGTKIRPRRETLFATMIRKKLFIPAVVAVLAIIAVVTWQLLPKKEVAPIPLDKPSIAVLPFEDLSPEKDQESFCDGLVNSIINAISHIDGLSVRARGSSFLFKGKQRDLKEIAEKLNVETVLEGSVQKMGNRLRLTAQLINTADESVLWSDRYDQEQGDVFAIQDEITMAIVDELRIELLGEERAKLVKRYTEDTEAFNLYSKGLFFRNKRTGEHLRKAIKYFEQAIEKDPGYALAYAGLADSHNLLLDYDSLPPKEAYKEVLKAKETALKALEIDSTIAEAHISLGSIKWKFDWDWDGAEKEYLRAVELNPGDANAHYFNAYLLTLMARFEEASREMKVALELDPLSLVINRNLGQLFYRARQYDRAIEALQKTLEMDPYFTGTHAFLGSTYLQKFMFEEALAAFKKEKEIRKVVHVSPMIIVTNALMGNKDEAQQMLNDLMERSKHVYVSPYSFAYIHVALGEKDVALEWLEKAYEEHDTWLRWLKVDVLFDDIRSDPRFKALLKKMNMD